MLIGPSDRVRLPAGVVVRDGQLYDPVRGRPIPVNGTGAIVAAQADGRQLAEIAAGLAAATGVAPERALSDTLAFCAELNRRLLLDVLRSPSLGLRNASLLLRGLRPGVVSRRGGLPMLAAPAAILALAGALAVLPLAALGGDPVLVLVGPALAAGLVLHEAGHAAALRGVPWCVTVTGLRVAILHRPLPPRRRAAVAAAGPVAAALGGAALLGGAWLGEADWAALAAGPFVAQALGLTVLARDGRTSCGLP